MVILAIRTKRRGKDMLDRAIKIVLLIGGLISFGFGLYWAILLSLHVETSERIGDAVVLIIVGVASLIIGFRETIKS